MKTTEQRINNIIGQLTGVKKMLADNKRSCLTALTQLKAIKSATASLMNRVVQEEFDRCLLGSSLEDKERIEKIFQEINKR